MFLIVGLGNPGPDYENTPHNLGFRTIDRLAEESGIRVTRREQRSLVGLGSVESREVALAKPQAYMNVSGPPVKALLEKYELGLRDLVVVYDDFNLPWASLRIRERGSAGGHHGVESIIAALGSNEFVRLRMGVGPDHPIVDGAALVLSPFRRSQEKEVEEFVGRAAGAVRSLLAEGAAQSMTKYNRRAGGSTIEEK
jgi:PTH1 family peptidyl-tRNA hydrolase